jgi:hypothetical protein
MGIHDGSVKEGRDLSDSIGYENANVITADILRIHTQKDVVEKAFIHSKP